MIEGSNHTPQFELDQELEATAVAGAAAVQKLIADRNNLRNQLAVSLNGQEDLRRRLAILHHQYIDLAKNVVSRLHHFDRTIRAALGEAPEVANETGNGEPKRQFGADGFPVNGEAESPHNGNGTTPHRNALPLEP
jgi:hypothetical protein